MVTPDEIENRVFSLVRRGYDPTEVDDFLREVATELGRAQAGLTSVPEPAAAPDAGAGAELAPPPPPPPPPDFAPDDFAALGEEVAAILRQAHQSVTELRHRAEAEAALIRQNAQEEAARLVADADRDRQAAGVELESARARAAEILAEAQAQSDATVAGAETAARARVAEVIEEARGEARGAVTVQRNVRGRLEGVRGDVDTAIGRLAEEDEDLFGTIDLTDATVAETGGPVLIEDGGYDEADVPPPGQGPPSPPVPPPTRASALEGLPYASDDDEDDEPAPAIDLTEPADDEATDDGDQGFVPPPPPPPPPLGDEGGAAAEVPDAPTAEGEDEDGLAQMVKDAVENALRRRKGDTEPPDGNGA